MTDIITGFPTAQPQIEAEAQSETVYFQGKPLKLKYTLWSLIQLQEVHGINLNDFQGADGEDSEINFADLVKLIWAGMIADYPTVQYQEVAEAFGLGDISALSAEMNRAISASTAVGKPALSAGLISH